MDYTSAIKNYEYIAPTLKEGFICNIYLLCGKECKNVEGGCAYKVGKFNTIENELILSECKHHGKPTDIDNGTYIICIEKLSKVKENKVEEEEKVEKEEKLPKSQSEEIVVSTTERCIGKYTSGKNKDKQ